LANNQYFPYRKKEVKTIINQLDSTLSLPSTTSCGRVLDAVSAILGICYERTYQGEPAMKLESVATCGYDVLKLELKITGGNLETTSMVWSIFEAKDELSAADLAYSAQSYLARGLAQLAVDAAQRTGIKAVGISGGVAYNKYITSTIRKRVEESGIKFYVHETLPTGDGGISFGQALAAAIQAD